MKLKQSTFRRSSLAAAALFAIAQPALAATCTWNPLTGNWSLASAWSCGLVPSAADAAIVAAGRTVTVSSTQSVFALNNAGGVDISGSQLILQGPSTTNNGNLNVNNGLLSLNAGTQTISGTGFINLSGSGARLTIEGTGTTTFAAGLTVRGEGNIGQPVIAGGNNTLVNNGLILADVSGGTLNIVPPAGSGSLVNGGILRATSGGTLLLSTQTNNAGGVINAQTGSAVVQNGISIAGGTLTSAGTGSIQAVSSSGNFLDGVTLNGSLNLTTIANARERVINGIVLNGAVNVANGGILSLDSSGAFGSSSNQTVSGTGTINLNDPAARLAIEGTGTTTMAAGITVRGQGNIGQPVVAGGNNNLVNNGLISADVSGGTLNIVAPGGSGSVVNNGTLQAVGGGTLLLSTNITNNTGSQITAGAGSAVIQSGVRLNGVININGAGSFQANSGSNFLDAVTLTGALDMTGIANARQRVVNGLTLNGAVNVANGGILSFDSSATTGGNQSITGAGTVNLNDPAARLAFEGTGVTTLAAGITVRGQGNIGQPVVVGGNNTLINNGLISADVSGGTLNIVVPGGSGSVVNNGTLRAVGGGSLLLSTDITNNVGSQITAGAGSAVIQSGVRLNGVININGSGSFQANSSSGNFLDAVTLTGALDLTGIANARERVVNGLTLSGAVNVANGGILSLDSSATSGGNQTIGGAATINLNDAAARLAIEGTGSTTLAAGVTVRGQGNIGQPVIVGGNNMLINNGLISADVGGGTLNVVAPGGSGTVVNNGTLRAVGGGTLLLSTSINSSPGSQIIAGAGSAVVQNGVTLNGVINVSGGGSFQPISSSSNFLDAATFNGTMDMTGNANSRQRLINGATINGAVNVANGGILSLDSAATAGGNQAIGGTAVINLNDPGARLAVEGTGVTTLAAGVTVRGQGNIGQPVIVGGTNTLIGKGLISADVAGGTLSIVSPAGSGTFVNNGTLNTTTGATMALPTNFTNNGLMKGTGTFNVPGTLTNAGTVAPGASPGTLALTGNYAQSAAGMFGVELQSLASHDLFNVTGTTALGGTLALSCFGACSYNVGDTILVLDSIGALTGTFSAVTLAGFATGAFNVIYDNVNNDVLLKVTQSVTAAVPEPESWALMLGGLAVMGWLTKRRQQQA
jgi:PEP-CTERM motif